MTEAMDWNAFNDNLIAEFRANGGTVTGPFEGAPLLYNAQAALMPNFAEYAKLTDRLIPVVVLERI